MIQGVGIGLRQELISQLLEASESRPDFVEVVPENWMGQGGRRSRDLARIAERYPLSCHGLSLSLGSPEGLDWGFLKELKEFLGSYPVQLFSEHLSFCRVDNAHLHELLPLPFCEEAALFVSDRIREVQDFLERPLAIENVSYYLSCEPKMSEAAFLSYIAERSDCQLLLDVNNVYVNAFNHGYDAKAFIASLPLHRVASIHMAGHERGEDFILDTHGEPICSDVFDLYEWTLAKLKPTPVLLERDFAIPSLGELMVEAGELKAITERVWGAYVVR